MNGFMKTATETGLTILPRTMTSDHNNSQQLFEKLNTPNNSTCCWNSSSNECKKHLEVWTRLQEMHGLGKERYHWFEKGLILAILPWPRVSSSRRSLLSMAVTKHVVYSKHIIQKRSFDSVLSSSPNSFTAEAKKQQLINNPCYSWICCCQRLWRVKGCTVEVQWKTGILQIHQFVLPSRCCMLWELGKLLWCLSAPSEEVPIWEEGFNHDVQTQSCRDVVLNNIKSKVVNLWCCSLCMQHHQRTPKHCSLVEKKAKHHWKGKSLSWQSPHQASLIPLFLSRFA